MKFLMLTALCSTILSAAQAQSVASRRLSQARAPGPSDGTDATCCALLTNINFSTKLPVVIVDTHAKNITRADTNSSICTCSQGLEKGDVNTTVGFRIRGGTDSQLRNHIYQYAIDIDDKKWFLGMPKSKKWMLYAQQLDPLGVYNWLGFEIARATGQYAPRTQFCEVFIIDDGAPLNTNNHYRGVYVAMEKVRQESNRVNISANNNPSDITGGYLAEFKHGQNVVPPLPTVNGSVTRQQWNIKYPKLGNITAAQLDYFQTYLNGFEKALYGPTFTDPATGWRKYADESTWVDWFLAIELIRNVKHSYHSSAFMQKDADKKLVMGPVWDNVQGFGQCCGYPVKGYENAGKTPPNPASGGNGISSSGWLFTVCLNDYCPILEGYAPAMGGNGISTWFQQLWKDPEWVKACADRYATLRAGPWSNATISGKVTGLQGLLGDAAGRTLTRWEKLLYQPQYYQSKAAQFTSELQVLSDWTLARLAWMDGAFKQAVIPSEVEGPYPSSYYAQAPISALSSAPVASLAATTG